MSWEEETEAKRLARLFDEIGNAIASAEVTACGVLNGPEAARECLRCVALIRDRWLRAMQPESEGQ